MDTCAPASQPVSGLTPCVTGCLVVVVLVTVAAVIAGAQLAWVVLSLFSDHKQDAE